MPQTPSYTYLQGLTPEQANVTCGTEQGPKAMNLPLLPACWLVLCFSEDEAIANCEDRASNLNDIVVHFVRYARALPTTSLSRWLVPKHSLAALAIPIAA